MTDTPSAEVALRPGAELVGSGSSDTLYRRFRPRRFDEVVGQDHAVAALKNAVLTGSGPHAYLLTGPRGCGKTSLARIFARALNCTNRDGAEPCGTCNSCVSIEKGSSFDLIELDAASNNGVDAMRDLTSKLSLASMGKFRVVIIDEVHGLSGAAAQALLKSLEEPPSHVRFLLATTDPAKLVPTIRSRCSTLQLNLVQAELLKGHLVNVSRAAGLTVGDDIVSEATRLAKGSVRDALSALEVLASAGTVGAGDTSLELLDAIVAADRLMVLKAVAAAVARGEQPRVMVEQTLSNLRDLFLVQMNVPELVDTPDSDGRRLERAKALGPRRAVLAMDLLGSALGSIRGDYDARIQLEVNLARYCVQAAAEAARPAA